jgi:hypothetical protein
VQHSQEVNRQFLKSCGDASQFFEPADALLDDVALPVGFLIEDHVWIVAGLLVFLMRNHRFDSLFFKPVADRMAAVAFVSGQLFGLPPSPMPAAGDEPRHHRLQSLLFADLAGRDFDGKRSSLAVSKNVKLRSKPAF